MSAVYTIGYEGADIERFIGTLKAVGVKAVADVRAVAVSRKKGFSKTALRERLEGEGIDYVHFVDLGDPKPGREAARAGEHAKFLKIYGRHLETRGAREALKALSELVKAQPTCLLCFERDHASCHRTVVANQLMMPQVKLIHLCADDPARYVRHAAKLQSHHPRQGTASA